MITAVSQNPGAIGYASVASVKDTVKALTIAGVAPGNETILEGTYVIQRPSLLVTKAGAESCGKSTFLKTLNRMNDLIPPVKITGQILYNRKNIFAAKVNHQRRGEGMVFQKSNPFPMSIYDNVAYGPGTHGIRNKAQLDDIVEKALRGAAIWDEVKDCLKKNTLDLLMIAKYFERIGDHCTNIAEWVAFSVTGDHQQCQ